MSSHFEVSKGALSDISQLVAGANRAEVALDALDSESLNLSQIARLKALAAKHESAGATANEASLSELLGPCPTPRSARYLRFAVHARQAALVSKFSIEVLGEGKIRLCLNGASRIEFLDAVQAVASELHGSPAVYADRLERWRRDKDFTAATDPASIIAVDGNVSGSTTKTRKEQEKRGWNDVDLSDLAVAHAAYFLATGKDMFSNHVVRARGGALCFDEVGLGVSADGGRFNIVAASAALPSRG